MSLGYINRHQDLRRNDLRAIGLLTRYEPGTVAPGGMEPKPLGQHATAVAQLAYNTDMQQHPEQPGGIAPHAASAVLQYRLMPTDNGDAALVFVLKGLPFIPAKIPFYDT